MQFALLRPVTTAPRPGLILPVGAPWEWVLDERPPHSRDPLALDWETRGFPGDPAAYPVGVALADSRGSVYLPFYRDPAAPMPAEQAEYVRFLRRMATSGVPLLAHNVPFDGAWFLRDLPAGHRQPTWTCTLAAYRLLATEGAIGQQWGLKAAMKDALGWADTNEAGIYGWLVEHGHVTDISNAPKEGYVAGLLNAKTGAAAYGRPDKGAMWRVPTVILGAYACLDAQACWELWMHVLRPAMMKSPVLVEYIMAWYPAYMDRLMRCSQRGISVDLEALAAGRAAEASKAAKLEAAVLSLPSVATHVAAWTQQQVADVQATMPPRWRKAPVLGAEPRRWLKKDTQILSKSWVAWETKRQRVLGWECDENVSAAWSAWSARHEAAMQSRINLGSGPQRAWLLYEAMGYPVLGRTDSGLPATDDAALQSMGEVGAALIAWQDSSKLLQFYDQTAALTRPDTSTIHPGVRVPGTYTGRLSYAAPNISQQPKDAAYLAAFRARPGYRLVYCDVASLENYVLAELSRCPALNKLYGPTARPGQDAYLFNAAFLPIIGDRIRATGYHPDTATAADTAAAKKACPVERAIGKVFTLESNYGAGAPKIRESLRVKAGIDIPLGQVADMRSGFWDLYKGIKKYERRLKEQWRNNAGWLLNGIGRPIGCATTSEKDLVNRVVQSTGHDLVIRLCHLDRKSTRLNSSH